MDNDTMFSRRASDKPLEERIALLEEKYNMLSKWSVETHDIVKDLSDNLTYHIAEEGARDAKVATKTDFIEDAVKELSNDIKMLKQIASDSREDLIRWNTMAKTIAKIATILVLIISAGWTIYTYAHENIIIKVEQAK